MAPQPRARTVTRLDRQVGWVVVAVLCVLVSTVIGLALRPWVTTTVPFITMFPAVAASASWRGFRSGMVAAVLGGLSAAWFFIPPGATLDQRDVVPVTVFLAGAAVISVIGGNLNEARARSEAARERSGFLADFSGALSSTTESGAEARLLATMSCPQVADACIVELLDGEGRIGRLEVAGLARQPTADGPGVRSAADVDRAEVDRGTAFVPVVSAGSLVARALEAYGIAVAVRSYVRVPLLGHDRLLGQARFFMTESDRRFGLEDRDLLAELTARTAAQIERSEADAELRARTRELDSVLGAVPDAVIVPDSHGLIRSHNAAAAALLGEIPRSIEQVRAMLSAEMDGSNVRVATTGRYVRPTRVRVRDGSDERQILMLRDVTELIEAEAARDAFLGILSHELRTPITTIYAGSALLLRPLSDQQRGEISTDINAESERLFRLVEDLLVLSRYERGRLDFVSEPVLLQRLLPRVARKEEDRWPGLCIDLTGIDQSLPPVVGDETYVEQVVRNLLSNAAKYAGTGEPVALAAHRGVDRVLVSVRDRGPGIPPAEAEAVFALFHRVPNAGQTAGGSGIGLFVCRRLIELMGGTIRVRPGGDGGAEFEFSLPIDRPPPERPSQWQVD